MIKKEKLDRLRQQVSLLLSERRYNHTLEVEKMAVLLAAYCLPEKSDEISAAALLHDITKELSPQCQLKILEKAGCALSADEINLLDVIHSFTAPYVVRDDFPDFATDEILSAISKHTLGDADMSVFDKIIFLADFIEQSRLYPDSISTRRFVLDTMKPGAIDENIAVLNRACIMEIDSTIAHLVKNGKPLNKKTVLAKASLISKI